MAMARYEDQRRSDRVPVRLVTAHRAGNYPLTLLNLSTTGMLLNSPRPLHVGDQVQVDLPEIGAMQARVVWHDTDEYGCQFAQPIPESVVVAAEAASRRNRPRVARQAPPRQLAAPPTGRHDDSRALVMLVLFLAFIVVLFYTGQALFVE